jgi:hypothetical protein
MLGSLPPRKNGRNRYEVNRNAHLRHPLFADFAIGPLLDVLRVHE